MYPNIWFSLSVKDHQWSRLPKPFTCQFWEACCQELFLKQAIQRKVKESSSIFKNFFFFFYTFNPGLLDELMQPMFNVFVFWSLSVFLDGFYCDLCEFVSSEANEAGSFALLLSEIKENDFVSLSGLVTVLYKMTN